jgi:methylmalonyl-CoA mutase, N-terminal domain
VAFDLPTQIGYDSDHPMAEGEVGKVGVAISSLEDMETLTDGIPLEQITTSMTINATGPILLALYVAAAKKQGVTWRRSAARRRTTSSRSTSRAGRTSSRRARRCG